MFLVFFFNIAPIVLPIRSEVSIQSSRLQLARPLSVMTASFLQLGLAGALALFSSIILIIIWWSFEFWRYNSTLRQFAWVDVNNKEWFPKLKAFLRGFSNARDVITKGYEEVISQFSTRIINTDFLSSIARMGRCS